MSESPSPTGQPRTRASTTSDRLLRRQLGEIDGKTANGLVRHSERYEIISVIDRTQAGRDAGDVLDGIPNGIPCCRDLDEALADAGFTPELFIVGVAPTSGLLRPSSERCSSTR